MVWVAPTIENQNAYADPSTFAPTDPCTINKLLQGYCYIEQHFCYRTKDAIEDKKNHIQQTLESNDQPPPKYFSTKALSPHR